MSYRVINGKIYSIEDISNTVKPLKKEDKNSTSFNDVLKNATNKKDGFVISNHAAERLKDRNISLNEVDMNRINEGINKAVEKGAKESLILYKDVVLVASVINRTIITAVDKESSKNNVFTNIDSVVLL